MKKLAAVYGTITVDINPNKPIFKKYKLGVYNSQFCTNRDLNHTVLMVGYGVNLEEVDCFGLSKTIEARCSEIMDSSRWLGFF